MPLPILTGHARVLYKRLSFLHRMSAESYFQGDNLVFNDQVNVLENLFYFIYRRMIIIGMLR